MVELKSDNNRQPGGGPMMVGLKSCGGRRLAVGGRRPGAVTTGKMAITGGSNRRFMDRRCYIKPPVGTAVKSPSSRR
ncbi:hypothetical protein MA16_Dca011439 [Dendrobium catenatum]|uniref:Uncharacterized protein n=1 Tax=Dendrobium catenatum TaxID=906689 RepID=A0A2I0WK91_9ASPA|nr:hypothetical protein MA16_Dca011439 [Dendrobium catenatum]